MIPPESEELFAFELYYNVGITNTGRFHVTINAAGVVTLERLRRELAPIRDELAGLREELERLRRDAICVSQETDEEEQDESE